MANPTTNFNWQMPTSSDLVTDLPADFEIFGQAVDTTLVDLKGGTTGQVLSKASNTDMDFTWVAQDDSNAIQNAIVDAKGDLIAATAADTPARLAVGSNNTFLRANSSASTGIEWAGSYTTFTPTYTNLTVGNGTNEGRYLRVGNTVHVTQKLVFGSTTSITGNVSLSFPISTITNTNIANLGGVHFLDAGVALYIGTVQQNDATSFYLTTPTTTGTYLVGNDLLNATRPFTWSTGDGFYLTYTYEVA